VIVSASPSNSASAATVDLFRAPLGRPLGLPDWPGLNRVSLSRIPAPDLLFQVIDLVDQYWHPPNRISPLKTLPFSTQGPTGTAIVTTPVASICLRNIICFPY
jgi:hypothetical protein